MFYFILMFYSSVQLSLAAHAPLTPEPNDDAFETLGVITVLCAPDYSIIAIIKPYSVQPSSIMSSLHNFSASNKYDEH